MKVDMEGENRFEIVFAAIIVESKTAL